MRHAQPSLEPWKRCNARVCFLVWIHRAAMVSLEATPTSWVLSTAHQGMRISGMCHLACSFSSFSPSVYALLAGERNVSRGRTRCHARSTWMRDHVCFELVDDGNDHSCFSLIHGLWDGVFSTKSTFMVWHVALFPPRRSGLWSPVWLRPR